MKNDRINEKLLIETAALAGEIMLVSGAEINRIEMTIQHILDLADGKRGENVALSTGIYISLDDPEGETITMVRRVADRSTNLNRIYMVNNVSRELCMGKLSVSEAYSQLLEIKEMKLYRPVTAYLGYVGTCGFFAMLFAGSLWDCFAAALVGIGLAAVMVLSKRIHFNDFCTETIAAFFIGIAVLCLKDFVLPNIHRDTVIVSAIMPLVPGVVFTTAIRDTLNGDYSAGVARMLEAITTALAVAAGVGASMGVFQFFMGGEYRW